jgi:hypothetical protein
MTEPVIIEEGGKRIMEREIFLKSYNIHDTL